MYYLALATDYDGTLATDGRVDEETVAALERLRGSGRRLIMVTGRELDDLERVFPRLDLFDRVVVENGALLYRPEDREEVPLGPPPPVSFVERLRERGVDPLSVGRVIVATWEPHDRVVFETIHELGLEHQIIFNKGAVMVLPPGVNKASGLIEALRDLELSPHNIVGVGDAENDHAFLQLCGCGVAVANALPMLKEEAEIVTRNARSAGVVELIEQMIASDLKELDPHGRRHEILLGTAVDGGGREIKLRPRSAGVLLAGTSGSGKSTLTAGLVERLAEHGYQVCIVDPEGDYAWFEGAVAVGDGRTPPSLEQALRLLERPEENVALNLLAVPLADRPAFFAELMPRLERLRARTGRPHWIVVDEAHHMLPAAAPPHPNSSALSRGLEGLVLVTVHPESVSTKALSLVDTAIAVGQGPERTIRAFCERAGREPPGNVPDELRAGEALVWEFDADAATAAPVRFRVAGPRGERLRHVRKYAEGELGEDASFYFRGPDQRLNLRAQNLHLFVQIAAGVDDATWLHHLRAGDYSRWFRDRIKDRELAEEVAAIERADLDAAESRERVRRAVERRYTAPA